MHVWTISCYNAPPMEKTSQSAMFLLKSVDPMKHVNVRSTIESLRQTLSVESAYIVPHGPGVDLLVLIGNTRMNVEVALQELQRSAESQGGVVQLTHSDELSIPFHVSRVEVARAKPRVIELENEDALSEFRFNVSSYLMDAGFTEKILDASGAAFYKGEEAPRGEEPVVIEQFLLDEGSNRVQMKIVLRMGKPFSEEAAQVLKKRIPQLVDVAHFNPVLEGSVSGRVYVFHFIAPRKIG